MCHTLMNESNTYIHITADVVEAHATVLNKLELVRTKHHEIHERNRSSHTQATYKTGLLYT